MIWCSNPVVPLGLGRSIPTRLCGVVLLVHSSAGISLANLAGAHYSFNVRNGFPLALSARSQRASSEGDEHAWRSHTRMNATALRHYVLNSAAMSNSQFVVANVYSLVVYE